MGHVHDTVLHTQMIAYASDLGLNNDCASTVIQSCRKGALIPVRLVSGTADRHPLAAQFVDAAISVGRMAHLLCCACSVMVFG